MNRDGMTISDGGSSQENKNQPISMSDMKFAVVPHTTRNKDNNIMGLT